MANTFEFVLQFVCCDTVSYLSNTYWIGRLIGRVMVFNRICLSLEYVYVIRCKWQCNDSAVLKWRCFAVDGGTVDQCIGITAEVRTLPTYGNSTWTYSILCNEVRIENSITLTSSAFYPIRIFPDPHFIISSNLHFSVYPTACYRIRNPHFTVYPNERIIIVASPNCICSVSLW